MKVLLTGANGQLGHCFKDVFPKNWELIATDSQELDITNSQVVDSFIAKYRPDAIVNAAGYTAVDKAETESQLAKAVNELGPTYIASAAKKYNAQLIHISTDYVFDGTKGAPYLETDQTYPINIYGVTKRDGEIAVLVNNPDATVIRTSWVFSEYGNNFVKTMLTLAGVKPELSIISDQLGCPTYAGDIAITIIKMLTLKHNGGIYHYCGDEVTNWFEFASKIFEIAVSQNIFTREQLPVIKAIKTAEYKTAANRPLYSILNLSKIEKFGIKGSNWKKALIHTVACLKK